MRVFNNLLYKVVALVVAALLWAVAQGVRNVSEGFDIPIVIQNQPVETVIVSQSHTAVNVRLQGSRAAIRQARKSLDSFPLSLTGLKPGKSRYQITTEDLALPRNARPVAHSPSSVAFEVDPVIERRVRVKPDIVADPPTGYRVKSIKVEPERVPISGAQRNVRRLREVLTEPVDLSTLRESSTVETTIALTLPFTWPTEKADGSVRVRVEIEPPPVEPGETPAPVGG